ncbi:MAG: glycosyltransferase [Candidatus Heimdallarchaeota archaeon]|nr:glycosyltransferase [Candidatus Heimdallarchaeota archaeon]
MYLLTIDIISKTPLSVNCSVMIMTDLKAPPVCETIFEVSNEIGNKIGGIYTVIASKAREMQRLIGAGNYFPIGLYNAFKARNDFEEIKPPRDFEEIFGKIRTEGITAHYGKWLGAGGVEIILVDPSHLLDFPIVTGGTERKIDKIKGLLWDWYNIDSLWMAEVFDPMVAFGWASGVLISQLLELPRFRDKNNVAHFHEWISGPGLLYLKQKKVPIATIFMTHATQLGRNLAMSGEDINKIIDEHLQKGETIAPETAYQFRVEGTHQLEVISAQEADLLLTVSKAVAREATCILGRQPDFVIPNGIDFESIAKKEELVVTHRRARLQMAQFIEAYFHPYYSINPEKLLIIHTSGRYEFKNKGIDVFIDALKMANERLKEKKTKSREILAFIWVPAPVSRIKEDVLNAIELSQSLRNVLQSPLLRIEEWLSHMTRDYEAYLQKSLNTFFNPSELEQIEKITHQISEKRKAKSNPPICPFHINEKDTIYSRLRESGLTNKQEDKVKVIFYPIYLSKNDKLLALNYYDAVAACDMGVYPSAYEPFGLTPLEALSLGVPAVTTDLTGFGMLMNHSSNLLGIHVLHRHERSKEEVISELAEVILSHAQLPAEELETGRKAAREISELYDWKNLIKEYQKACSEALKRAHNRLD